MYSESAYVFSIQGVNMEDKEENNSRSSLVMTEENYVKRTYPVEKTIHQLFLDEVNKTPNNIALVFNNKKISYKELNDRADMLARVLADKGVKEDGIVGVLIWQSFELIIAMLAILKAGGAYMILEPDYPAQRIEYMLKNCGADILLTVEKYQKTMCFEGTILSIDKEIQKYTDSYESVMVKSNALAYVLYTSGSTGNPKAIMEEHKNVVNAVNYLHSAIGDKGTRNVLQFFNPSFTVSYQEIFTTLLFGGTLHIVDGETRNNVGKLFDYISDMRINTIFLPSSYIKTISKEERYFKRLTSSLEHIITAGEKLIITEVFLEHLKNNDIKVYNNFGNSEVNLAALYTIPYTETRMDNLPIGKPSYNTYIYVLDENLKPVSIGCEGELYIAGDSVSRGYYNNKALTDKKFVADPFHGGIMFKSGDIGRWNENGYLELMGRRDFQLKIRGFRVEIGEIEYHLFQYPAIKEAAVVAKGVEESNVLYAYIVSDEEIAKIS